MQNTENADGAGRCRIRGEYTVGQGEVLEGKARQSKVGQGRAGMQRADQLPLLQ